MWKKFKKKLFDENIEFAKQRYKNTIYSEPIFLCVTVLIIISI